MNFEKRLNFLSTMSGQVHVSDLPPTVLAKHSAYLLFHKVVLGGGLTASR
jgi:hypothetical protein